MLKVLILRQASEAGLLSLFRVSMIFKACRDEGLGLIELLGFMGIRVKELGLSCHNGDL